MLPSQYPEVQSRHDLRRLLAEHVDMQFDDLRTMMRLPAAGLTGGCNFAAAAVMFNIIAGSSVCFHEASEAGLKARGERSKRFLRVVETYFPWEGEPVSEDDGARLLYEAARNPLAHSVGLDEPPTSGTQKREIQLGKRPLTPEQVEELEDSVTRPTWLGNVITSATAPSGAPRIIISVPGLFWGLHRMLRALFADPTEAAKADALAKKFGQLWDKYIGAGDAITVSDAVKIERA